MKYFNIEIQEGTSYQLTLNFVNSVTLLPVNLSGYSGVLNVTPSFESTPSITLSTDAQNIEFTDTPGQILLYFSAPSTLGQSFNQAPYSLSLTDPTSNNFLLLRGNFTIITSPYSYSTNPLQSSPPVVMSMTIPVDYAYYVPNTGTDMGSSASYFVSSGVDWGV